MSIFDDEEDNSGLIALAEVKKIKRAIVKLHSSMEIIKKTVANMERDMSRLEGSLDTLTRQRPNIQINQGMEVRGEQ